jgi:hypothetical protein
VELLLSRAAGADADAAMRDGGATALILASRGGHRARSHCRFVLPLIHFIPYPLTYSVPLFLKRQCDRAPGGHADCAAQLLKGGASANIKAEGGITALIEAVAQGHAAIVRLLPGLLTRGVPWVPPDPLAPRRGPLGFSPDRESAIVNAPTLVQGPLPRM